jgi:hypothetical protein
MNYINKNTNQIVKSQSLNSKKFPKSEWLHVEDTATPTILFKKLAGAGFNFQVSKKIVELYFNYEPVNPNHQYGGVIHYFGRG